MEALFMSKRPESADVGWASRLSLYSGGTILVFPLPHQYFGLIAFQIQVHGLG